MNGDEGKNAGVVAVENFEKRDPKFARYRSRHFVLYDTGVLKYYAKDIEKDPKQKARGAIKLSDINGVDMTKGRKKNCIEIKTSSRNYILHAKTNEICQRWITLLRTHVEESKSRDDDDKKRVSDWTTNEVEAWLDKINFSNYKKQFAGFDGEKLVGLNNSDMRGLVEKKDVNKILQEIARLRDLNDESFELDSLYSLSVPNTPRSRASSIDSPHYLSEMRKLQDQISQTQSEKEQLLSQKDKEKAQLKEALQQLKEELKQSHEKKEMEIAELQQKIEKTESRGKELEKELEAREEDVTNSEAGRIAEFERMKAENERLTEQKEKEHQRLQDELSKLKKKLKFGAEEKDTQFAELQRKNNAQNTQLEKANVKLEKMNAELEKTGTELEKTSTELEKTGTELEKTGTELEKTSTELEKTNTELEETNTELEKTKAEEHDKEQLLINNSLEQQSLQKKINELEESATQYSEQITELNQSNEIPHLEEEIRFLKEENERLTTTNESMLQLKGDRAVKNGVEYELVEIDQERNDCDCVIS